MSSVTFDLPPERRHLARRLGITHLVLAGLVNVVSGIVILTGAVTDRLLSIALRNSPLYATDAAVVARWPLIRWLATDGATAAALLLLLVGATGLYASYLALTKAQSRTALVAGAVTALNPLALPLAFIAVALLAVSSDS